jgi:anion-transporting  ArsA/GET3 family ATPase
VKQLLKKGSTIVVLGTGGVGKTTVAAALGVAAARLGLDTGVVTIDPSHRLRDALGMELLSARPTRLEARRLRAAALDPALQLSAMVLDVKRTWDGLVARFVKTPAARRRILENSFYRSLTQQFAGAEAYAALEQLYDLHNTGRFDLAIVDTPPAAHAFEFLESPAHLVRLLDSRAARWLFLPYASARKSAVSLVGRAARFVVTQLESFAGASTLTSVSEFFGAAAEATSAIVERFRKTEALLRSPGVYFVLVTTSEQDRLREACELVRRMESQRLTLGAVILNRTFDERTFDALASGFRRIPAHLDEIDGLRSALAGDQQPDQRLDAVVRFLEEYRDGQLAMIGRAARFASEIPSHIRLVLAPELEIGVRDLRGLAKLASMLTGVADGRKVLMSASALISQTDRVATSGRRAVR